MYFPEIKTKQNNFDIYVSTPLAIIFIILKGYAQSSSMKLFQMSTKNGIVVRMQNM